MGMHKNSPKTKQIWHLGMPLGNYCPMSYIFRKLFSGTFPYQIVCFYLEWFKSNRASKLTILEKSLQKFNIFGCLQIPQGATAPCHTSLERSFTCNIWLADSMPVSCII